MNIVWVTSESTPFAKTGGLADVSEALPKALAARGHHVSVIMPWYPQKMSRMGLRFSAVYDNLKVPFDGGEEWARILEYDKAPGLKYYFVEFNRFYDRPTLYDWGGTEYSDNAARFIFLSRAAMEICVHLKLEPDILHANDWHSALCCVYLKSELYAQSLPGCRSVLTIHNVGYQGSFDKGNLFWTGLGWQYFNYMCLEFYDRINLLKGGIMTADMVSTVSPTYAREILSRNFAFGLEGPLQNAAFRGKLRGILNGIDVSVWNPRTDRLLPARYSEDSLEGKALCKQVLQNQFGLVCDPNRPLFAVISRLAFQKGLDILADSLEDILPYDDWQFVILASGDKALEARCRSLAERFPGKLAAFLGYAGDASAHLAEAGADFFVMPSRYEPCGLNQMYSMAYGTLPVVRHTGGLADTVVNYDRNAPSKSTGFVLWDLNRESLRETLRWAAGVWYSSKDHIALMRRCGMTADFSWNHTAEQYEKMYNDARQ